MIPNWKPLESFCAAHPGLDPGWFMLMTQDPSTGVVQYKNVMTRRYLNLSEDGRRWINDPVKGFAPDPLSEAERLAIVLDRPLRPAPFCIETNLETWPDGSTFRADRSFRVF